MSRLISSYQVLTILLLLFFFGCQKKSLVTVVHTNGEEIHFSNNGDGDITLLFIHGFGNNQGIWEGQISNFSSRYKVIAVDLPGFGLSSHNRLDWTMENYGKDIAGLIHELKLKKVVLIGFSMGAPVAIEAAKILDEELLGLVLVDQIKDINLNFPKEAVEGISAFIYDLLANPSEEKLVKGGFIKQNTSETYQKVLKMIEETSSNEAWDDILANTFNWVNEKDEEFF